MAYTPADVNAWYQAVQFRDGPAATVASTVALLNSGSITPAAAQLSIINDSFTNTYVNPMIRIYQAAFNRVPDQAGQNFWVDNFAAGTVTTLTAATDFANSTEFKTTYGNTSADQPINAAILTAFYNNVLNRSPDAAGYQFWLNSGQTIAQVLNYFAQSPEFTADSANAINQFQQAEINGNPATSGSLFQYGGFPTDTVALTTGVDTFNLTKNSTVTGISDTSADAGTTYQSFDTITSAAGTNSILSLTLIGDGTKDVQTATVSGISTINIRNAETGAGSADTISAATFVGATSVNSVNSSADLTITNLAAGQALGVVGNGSSTNGAVIGKYAAAATAATLNLSTGVKGGADKVLGDGLTAVNITSSGATNSLTSLKIGDVSGPETARKIAVNISANTALDVGVGITNLAAGSTITVSGGATNLSSTLAAVRLGTLDSDVTTVDASGLLNGGIQATLGAASQAVKGGQGNDIITTAAAVQTGAVDAGAGTADTLIVANSAAIGTTGGAKFTNFEVLGNLGGGATLDVSTVAGITSIQLLATGQGATQMTAAQAAAITNYANNNILTLGLADASGSSDVLNVVLADLNGATTSSDLTNATITGFETFNVTSSAGSFSDINSVSFAAAGNLTKLVATGAAPLQLDTANITKAVAIDASGLTAVGSAGQYTLTLSGNLVKGSSVVSSDAADSLTTTAAVAGTTGDYVSYNAAGGDDLVTSTVAAINNTGAGFASLKLDGGTGTDTLSVNTNTYVDANFQYLTNFENVTFTGNGVLNVVTGGFFDANFKANGITATAATLGVTLGGSAALNVFDDSTFTGATNLTMTQNSVLSGDSNVGDSFTINTGSGADTVALTTTQALTTANTISTNDGNDTVTLTNAALGAGSLTVNLGRGDDTFTGSGAAVTVTGAQGADSMTAGVGVVTFNYGTVASITGQTGITLATADNIVGFTSATDFIKTGTAGTAGNYGEGGAVADYAAALAAANNFFALDNTKIYYLTSSTADNTGLLFVNTDANATADAVIKLAGITSANFAATDIVN